EVFTETSKIPIKSKGVVNQIITILRDITIQKEAEEKYRYLIENALEGVWVIDSNAYTTLVNPSMAKMLGYSVDEMIGKSLFSFIDDDQTKITKLNLEKRKKGISEERDGIFLHKNGNNVHLRIKATPIFDKEGNYDGTYAFVADITERKELELKIIESEVLFRKILENTFIGFGIQQDNKLIYVNNALSMILEYSIEELLNLDLAEYIQLIPPAYQKLVMDRIQEHQKGDEGVVTSTEFPIYTKNGNLKWINTNEKSISYNNKTAILSAAMDITEMKAMENELRESEEKFRTIAEQSFMGIIILQDGIFKYFNEQAAEMNGYSAEEIRNWEPYEFSKLIHPEDRDFVLEQARKKQQGDPNVVSHYKYRVINKNEEVIWVENYSKTINYGGRPADFVMTIDSSDKIKAEEKLRESEENFRTIAEQAFIGTLIMQNGKVEYVNNALLQIFEFSHEEIENWRKDDLIKLIHPEDLQYLREYREKLRNGESDIKQYYSYRVFTKYGKIKWIDQFSRPIIYKGMPAEIITIMDITEKKRAEEELIKLNSLKSELLRRTSHELKTPLVSIKGFSDLLLTVHKDKLDDYVLATIHEIKLGCERLENLIQDILKTSELESESVELKKSQEDLSFLIKLCIKELQGLIKLRNHEINLEIHDKLMTYFEADQIHLVISNLLNNAIKYTPPNGRIEIKSAIMDDSILISIQDNGIGITNEEKKRLFSQFGKIERYGQGLDIISDGSGLGLFITKKIVELHGGRIWVRSKGRNKGSTFYFTLPLIIKK
ncbi:MAG: PAS domain S-box protein, partial [Promethearchaeota archaeon]